MGRILTPSEISASQYLLYLVYISSDFLFKHSMRPSPWRRYPSMDACFPPACWLTELHLLIQGRTVVDNKLTCELLNKKVESPQDLLEYINSFYASMDPHKVFTFALLAPLEI